jgi:hypothetical protein
VRTEATVPANARAPSKARDLLDEASPPGFPDGWLEDARLVLTEIIGNAVRHADWNPRPGEILLRFDADDARLRVEVEQPTTAAGVRVMELPVGDALGRFGLRIVAMTADDWGHDDGPPGMVWFEFRRARDARGASTRT